jgi:hypothetical protein
MSKIQPSTKFATGSSATPVPASSVSSTLLLHETQSTTFSASRVRSVDDLTVLELSGSPVQLVYAPDIDTADDTADASPHLVAFDVTAFPPQAQANEENSASFTSCPVFASSSSSVGERMLLVSPPNARVCKNGIPAPVISSLELGDQVSTNPAAVLHVSKRRQAFAAQPSQDLVGKQCPLCLVPFTAETRVRECDSCGAARHMEGDEVAVQADRLQCWELGVCPICSAEAATTTQSLAFIPEGIADTESPS